MDKPDTGRNFAVIIPIGPSQADIERTCDLLESLWHYEPGTSLVVLIDDGPAPRNLPEMLPAHSSCKMVSLYNDRAGKGIGSTSGLAAGILLALRWISENADPGFVIKLDTDALVIASFADKLHGLFTHEPAVGMVGLFKTFANGQPRDYRKFKHIVTKLNAPFAVWKTPLSPLGFVTLHFTGCHATIRRHIREAIKRGYETGEFILGGAYVCSGELIRRMAGAGYFEDPKLWLLTHISEDAMLSLYARAVGLELKGFASLGEVFGVEHIGLPFPPEQLVEKGYSIIHSTKWDDKHTENEIRAFFRARRL